MSYRSFKRVLGETSLERKCRFLFGACLLLLITGSFWWYSRQTEPLVRQASQRTGRGLVDAIMLRVHWEIWETRDETPEDKENKAFLVLLGKNLEHQVYHWDVIHPPGRGERRPQDEFEYNVLERFRSLADRDDSAEGKIPAFEDRRMVDANGRQFYQYYQPVYAKNDCVICHLSLGAGIGSDGGPPSLNVGDLLGVVKVVIPDDETQRALNQNRAILLATAIITVFLAMIASYVIVRYVIVKPLKHLRDVSDEVSHGNIALRADIHTGDEFEELGLAFNRMLRQLTTAQSELRDVNADLNVKVDELAQANMRLHEMNRLKSDFLATMSHELRTPLNAIIGFSDVLESIASLDDKQKRYLKNIQTSGKVLLEMINDVLDLAKLQSDKMEVRLSDFRIEQVVRAQCDMSLPHTERKNIDLEIDIEPSLPEMFQDQSKVQQILGNLLSNAIKFTPEGGRITVSAKRGKRGDLFLTVADTGVGIAEEDQTAIFDKFRQGKAVLTQGDAMTREYSGTGLGLSIVKELCKLLGGEISLESALGKGSTFTVRLPWTRADQPRPDQSLAAELDEMTKPRRVDFFRDREETAESKSEIEGSHSEVEAKL